VAVLNDADLSALPLLDGHCHPILAGAVDEEALEMWCTESALPLPQGMSYLDSQLGQALRRWCPPALGLPAHSSIVDYLAAREALAPADANRRLLRAANLTGLLVDTGVPATGMLGPSALAEAALAPAAKVVRLETLAESLIDTTTAANFADAFTQALQTALTDNVVALKSILAYRHGLDIQPQRPTASEVSAAAGRWLQARARGRSRLTDPVLLRFLLWNAVDTGRPIQLHTGFGDADATLVRADPAQLQPFCAATVATGTALVLLHCYPYHRQAGWLAHVYPHVYVDLGLTLGYVGARAGAVLGEFLELAPFGKVLYSSDAYGLAELYLIGAAQFRHALRTVLDGFTTDGAIVEPQRVAEQIGFGNAVRLYGQLAPLDGAGSAPAGST
jgi:predicted TIM-barrel fold metal-dependent hydrolase